MPRSAVVVFAFAALVAATAFAYQVLVREESALPPEAGGADAATVAALRDLGERLDRVEHEVFQPRLAPSDPVARLADLEARVHTLEKRPVPHAPAAPAATTRSPGEQAPRADLRSLTREDLVVKARSLAGSHAYDAAAAYWRELLDRNPSDELFVEAHIQLGYAYRAAKDHDREEETFREALRVAGADSEKGQKVLYQLAWTANYRGDYAAARDLMTSVANAPATSRTLTGHARLNGAYFSQQLNDREGAREALQSMLRDFGNSTIPVEAWFARQATERLEQLK